MSSSSAPVLAVLFQAIDPPAINGIRKPRKPGGYQDSGADIGYILQKQGVRVITPSVAPSITKQEGWTFPDTEEGIISAVQRGATHLWANTILFSSHPLQTSAKLRPDLRIMGQPPILTEIFDDKAYLNDKLREISSGEKGGGFNMPQSWLIDESRNDVGAVLASIPQAIYPVVGKPVRGRGSHGVKKCSTPEQLREHVDALLPESPVVMIEEYLAGEEATVTVMPPNPSDGHNHHWSLPPVTRFNHVDGVAPYNGEVAVTANSRAVSSIEVQNDPAYGEILDQCARVGDLIGTTAPIRIDVRRRHNRGAFVVFDINLKPVCFI